MSKFRFLLSVIAVMCMWAPAPSYAAPTKRGFQILLNSIDDAALSDLVTNWKVNFLRIQIGNDMEMDGKTGAAYDAMMEEQFDLLDEKLPLIAAHGLKVIFILYSPPGGFQTRQGPSHYQMFSDPALQTAFIDKWKEIMTRYGSNETIMAFDLVNEPASRKGLLAAGALPWGNLAKQTIAAIRTIAPTRTLIVKPLYGDPGKLAGLPAFNDGNVEYAYNSYYFLKYQHTGVTEAPFSINRPEQSRLKDKMESILAPFFFKMKARADAGDIPASAYPPKLNVGEVAVSGCARESEVYLADLLTLLEVDNGNEGQIRRDSRIRRYRRRKRRGFDVVRPVFEADDFVLDIKHSGYAIHAYDESRYWDPRYVCNSDGSFTLSSTDTGRATVLKSFFSRN